MGVDQEARHREIAQDGLADLLEAFAEEVGRPPSLAEVLEILTWGLRSCSDDVISDVNGVNVLELVPKIAQGGEVAAQADDAVDDLNDAAFSLATELFARVSAAIAADTGEPPTLKTLLARVGEAIDRGAEGAIAGLRAGTLTGIGAKLAKKGKIASRIGDIVAIPSRAGDHLLAVVLAKNDIGTAYGFFEGRHRLRPVSAVFHPPVRKHPVYSSDRLVAQGVWRIVGHDEQLLSLLPAEPEIYFREQLDPDGREIGPYGAAQTPAGRWRDLDRQEAEAVGLLEGTYRQVVPPEFVEAYLDGEWPPRPTVRKVRP